MMLQSVNDVLKNYRYLLLNSMILPLMMSAGHLAQNGTPEDWGGLLKIEMLAL